MEKISLLLKEAKSGCSKSRGELLNSFEYVIHKRLERIKTEQFPPDVLIVAGKKGLEKAIDEYIEEKNVPFDVFANHVVSKRIFTEIHKIQFESDKSRYYLL